MGRANAAAMNPEPASDIDLHLTTLKYSSLVYLRNGRSVLWDGSILSPRTLENVRLCMEYTPDYLEPQEIPLGRVAAGVPFRIGSLPLPNYNRERLMAVMEEEPGTLHVSLKDRAGNVLAEQTSDFTWLAHHAWAGGFEFPEMLAALTLPEDPAVDTVLADTQQRLQQAGQPAEWVGYHGTTEQRVAQLRALWDTLADYRIQYALPPNSWLATGVGQRVRTPSAILEERCSTCLDSTLLLAAVTVRMGLNPIVILVNGHAFLGIWMKPAALPRPQEVYAATLRNAMKQGDILLVETTVVNAESGAAPAPFELAAAVGADRLEEPGEGDFFLALDIRMLWHECGIRPIVGGTGGLYESAQEEQELVTGRPQGRMETWQRKLLDMSLRNNLLNCRPDGRRQLGLLLPDVGKLEDELAAGTAFRLREIPLTAWNVAGGLQRDRADLLDIPRLAECVETMFAKHELPSVMPDEALQRSLQTLYTATRREMEESGSNTLYLACGFLKWYRRGVTDKAYYAPLLLIPVQLTRPSVRAGFTLRGSDEETRMNLTLLEFLKTEFELELPELQGELPTDASGLDVAAVFNIVRRAVSGMPGWEVDERCTLGSFSFTKYLMWKDLTDRRDALLKNPIVAQIAAERRSTFPDQGGFPAPNTLDSEVDARQIFTPLSSDSSQLSAVLAAARGKSFVLIGPPGTGKSQTITNMIAHCLGHGKTVLFVAEKAAALEVVHNRLRRIGLEDFCLELHSHKANKKEALAQFKAAVDAVNGGQTPDRWEESVSSVTTLRERLNELPATMHRAYPDEGTLYGDIGLLAEHEGEAPLELTAADPMTLTREQLNSLTEQAQELARHYSLVENIEPAVLREMPLTNYSSAWEEDTAAALQRCAALSREQAVGMEALATALSPALARPTALRLRPLLETLAQHPERAHTAFLPSYAEKTLATLRELCAAAAHCRELRARLSLPYPDSVLQEPELDAWLRRCRELMVSNFISRWFGLRKMRKMLCLLAMTEGKPDCLRDLTALTELRDARRRLAERDWSALPAHLFKGEATGAAEQEEGEESVRLLRALLPEDEEAAARLFADPALLPTPLNAAGRAAAALTETRRRMQETQQQLSSLLGHALTGREEQMEGEGAAWAESLLQQRTRWRDICIWNQAAREAAAHGGEAMVRVLTDKSVAPRRLATAVRLCLARRRVCTADAQAPLSAFTPQVHEERIAAFAKQDGDLMRRTGAHIRSLLTARASRLTEFGQETSLLQRELSKQRGHMPLRRLLSSLPNVATLLKPCLLMSPLSVAQYLTTETAAFDVVIFDEASQIPVWDAIGVIARGRSAVIVGDPRQMPPTSFFSRSRSGAEEEEESGTEADMESILDECRACGIPEMNLSWHYRSKSESLIAFSNKKYYEDRLTTFPAPVTQDKALCYHHTGGVYESGATKRINREEARQLVDHVLAGLRAEGFRYTEATSIGIVTFNTQQQALIESMLEKARAEDETLEPYFAEDNPEAVFVKNLENVQGDERGVIYFSTTYGRDSQGHISMNFGPLNLSGGERRLNVAITRARCALHVFTSMAPEDINLNRTNARGAADLHDFLDYARRGAGAYLTGRSADAVGMEEPAGNLCRALQAKGWNCRRAVGVSGYRIDVAVEHPEIPGSTLAGIMLDGSAYAASHTARDRDVLRPSVLKGLGWRLIHLWSIDWWRHPDYVVQRVDEQLKEFLRMGLPEPPVLPELVGAAAPAAEKPAPAAAERPAAPSALLGKEYRAYEPEKPLPPLFEMSDSSLSRVLRDFVAAEEPVAEPYLLQRLPKLSVNTTASATLKRHLEELLDKLITKGTLCSTVDRMPGEDDTPCRVFTLPQHPAVCPRSKGPREWKDIPVSELKEVADLVRVHLNCLPGCDDHLKGISTYCGISRQTKPLKDALRRLLKGGQD